MKRLGTWLAVLLPLCAAVVVAVKLLDDRQPPRVLAGPAKTADTGGGNHRAPDVPAPAREEQPSDGSVAGRLTAAQIDALRYLDAPDRDGRADNAALGPLGDWARQDPAGCAGWVMANLTGTAQRRALDEAVTHWLQQQAPHLILDWLDRLGSSPAVTAATGGAYTLTLAAWAEQDGASAATWLNAHAARVSSENWQSVLGTWAEDHSPEAFRWVMENPLETNLKDELLPSLLTSFRDPGTTAMLTRGGSPAVVDGALERAARSTSTIDPAYALSLARQITDPAARGEAVDRVFERWLQSDAPAAQAYAAKVGLPLPSNANPAAATAPMEQPVEAASPDAPPVPPK